MYTKVEEAIHFMVKAYKGQKRKNENIDASFHSMIVGMMIRNITYSEDVIVAAILHDIIEDTSYDYDFLLNKFGKELADGVKNVSELKATGTWREKKEAFITKLEVSSNEILAVELADKLQNLVSDYNLFISNGSESLLTESDSLDNFKWYYTKLQSIFNSRLERNELLNRYNNIIDLYFNN